MTVVGLHRVRLADADEDEVLAHAFRRERDVPDLGEAYLEGEQEKSRTHRRWWR
jgi:hypothetical protein